jgi:hypothetical protein
VRRTLLAGAVLAAAAALLVAFGDSFGLDASRFALLGAAVGAVLGLVPSRLAAERAAAWAVGFLVAWLGYAVRLALLPDTPSGRAVAAAIVVLAVAAVAALSFGRLPLWAGLLGVASMTGGYEVTAVEAPLSFTTDSVTAATTVALAASVGFLITSLMVRVVPAPTAPGEPPRDASVPGPRHAEPDTGMGILDWTRSTS